MKAYGQDDRLKQQIFMRNSRKHQNKSDNVGLLAVVKLDFGQGETKTLHVHESDDVVKLAEQFCIDNELEEDCVEHMVQYITQQIKNAQKNSYIGDSDNLVNNFHIRNDLQLENHQKDKSFVSVQNSSEKDEEEEELQSETTSSSSSSQHKLFHFQSKEKIENYQRRTTGVPHLDQNQSNGLVKYIQTVKIGEEKYISKQNQQEIQQKEIRNKSDNNYPPSESECQVTYEKWSKLISERKTLEQQQRQRIVSEYQNSTALTSPSYQSSSRNVIHSIQAKTEDQLLILDKIRSENLLPPCIGQNRQTIKKSMIIGNIHDEQNNHPQNARKSIQKNNILISNGSASQLPQGKKEKTQNISILDLQQSRRESVQQNEIQWSSQRGALTSRNLTPKQRFGLGSPRGIRDLSNNIKKINSYAHTAQSENQSMANSKRLSTTPEKKIVSTEQKVVSRSPSPMNQRQGVKNIERDGKHIKIQQVQQQQHDQAEMMSRSKGKRDNSQNVNKSDNNNHTQIPNTAVSTHFSSSVSSLLHVKNINNTQFNKQNINIIQSNNLLQNPPTKITPSLENKALQSDPKQNQIWNSGEQRTISTGPLKSQQNNTRNNEDYNFKLILQDNIFAKMDANKDGWISVSDVAIEEFETAELEILQEFLYYIADNSERKYSFADFYEYIRQHKQVENVLRELFIKKYGNNQINQQRETLQSAQQTYLNNNFKNNLQNHHILQTDFSEFSFAEDNPSYRQQQTNQNDQFMYAENQSNGAPYEHSFDNQDIKQFQSQKTPPNERQYQYQQQLQQNTFQQSQYPLVQPQDYFQKEPSFGIEQSLIDVKQTQFSQPPSFVSGRYKSLVNKKQTNYQTHLLS